MIRTDSHSELPPGAQRFQEGLQFEADGRTKEAVEAYREAIRYDPRLAQAHFNLGVGLAVLGEHEQAVRAWRRAVWLRSEFQNDLILALDIEHELREIEVRPQG
jgi:tetratricopeptide (TPR) repeat protein